MLNRYGLLMSGKLQTLLVFRIDCREHVDSFLKRTNSRLYVMCCRLLWDHNAPQLNLSRTIKTSVIADRSLKIHRGVANSSTLKPFSPTREK